MCIRDRYSLGNQVWFDTNNDGEIDAGEQPLSGVWVYLFTDNDGDGQPDDVNNDGVIDADDALATTATDADGLYLFDGLEAGTYIVGILESEFDAGEPLDGFTSSGPTSANPNDDVDNDENGVVGPFGVFSGPVALNSGEPLGENPDNDTTTLDGNSNLTVDFGFWQQVFDWHSLRHWLTEQTLQRWLLVPTSPTSSRSRTRAIPTPTPFLSSTTCLPA